MNIIRLTFGTLLLSLGCAHSHSLESIVELGAKYEAHGQKEKAVLLYEEALQRETPTQNHLHLGIYYYELAKLSDDAFQSRGKSSRSFILWGYRKSLVFSGC